MQIELRQSNWSQFSDDIWLRVEHEGTSIDTDIDKSDLIKFAYNLIDIACDCLHKSKVDTEELKNQLADILNTLSSIEENTQ